MELEAILTQITGPLGAIAVGYLWNRQLVKDHTKDRDTWEKQIATKDERIRELTDENQKMGTECVSAIIRVMEGLNKLTPCKFSHDSKPS